MNFPQAEMTQYRNVFTTKTEGICPRLQEGVLHSRDPAQHGQRPSREAAPHLQGGGRASITR